MRIINMQFLIGILLFTSLISSSYSQKEIISQEFAKLKPLSPKDSMELANLPKLTIPFWLKGAEDPVLPTIVDNSTNSYWRPVFAQVGMECGQASGIGMAFTYAINRERNLSGDIDENQYTPHFAWNFANGGQGWYGVSYFHSFEIARTLGIPNIITYGGLFSPLPHNMWMTGYENYYQAMQNRISEIYQIDVSDELGIETLKHWLHNNLEGADDGGVANFYSNTPPYNPPTLPSGTPEEGKCVIVSQGGTSHSMTICGYNDSICWDYNNDGQYTNDIDITGDGIVNTNDWEIGGLKFANTYNGGPGWANNGFCYMTYNSLSDPSYGGNGVWNNAVHVMYAKENCSPQLTAKITLKHNRRNQIRVRMGVSADQTSETPEYIIGFPVFDFQGGGQYMQGGDSNEENKTIEFGLDLTPLLNLIGPNIPARYFLLVDEDDPSSWGQGEIIQYSIIDYTDGVNEIECLSSEVSLNNNSLTKLWVDHNVNFDKVEITMDTLPSATVFESYSTTLEAVGGSEPYYWDFDLNYTETNYTETFPMITAQQLNPGNNYSSKTLDFAFPFAGEEFNTVKVFTDGYLLFGSQLSWPYQVYDFLLFTKNKYIAPFMAELVLNSGDNDGVWYEGDENSATFRWKASIDGYQSTSELNFAVQLFSNGDIKFFFGEENDYPPIEWISGISSGNNKFYQFTQVTNDISVPSNYVCDMKSSYYPEGFEVSHDGIFSGLAEEPLENFEIKFMVADENNLRDSKVVYFSTDGSKYLVIDDYWVWANGNDIIEFGEIVQLSVEIKNIGEENITGAYMQISLDDEFIILTDSTEVLGDFESGEKKTFTDAFAFEVGNQVPDGHEIVFNTLIMDDLGDDWNSHIYLIANAPDVYAGEVVIDDGENGGLEPGETTDIIITLYNDGGATANNLIVTLNSNDSLVSINNNTANLDDLESNSSEEVTFNITASDEISSGYLIELELIIQADNEYFITTSVYIVAGLITEGFESASFSAFPWSLFGDAEWMIDNSVYYEGDYCARSGDIGDDQSSSIMLEINVLGDGGVSFYKKVSCEDHTNGTDYDFLAFYIDGIKMGAWDGEMDWMEVSYPITQGIHTLTWSYEKDGSVSSGSDCAWIDFIKFPLFGDPNPQVSYNPESFIFTIGNEIISDTISIFNEGTGPLIYSINVADTIGNNIDWLSLDIENGGLNAGNIDEIQVNFDATDLEEGNYVAHITITDHMDNNYIIPVFMYVDIASGLHGQEIISKFENIPNPFSHKTTIRFSLVQAAKVSLGIYNLQGKKIQTLISNIEYTKGGHAVVWNAIDEHGSKVESGVYFYRLSINNEVVIGKMILKN